MREERFVRRAGAPDIGFFPTPMKDIHQLFQAFVAPAIFVSAEGLLLLSLNVRLMGIVSRLRSHLHKKHDAAQQGRFAESEAYASQIASIEARAELIRRGFVLTLYGLIGTTAACLLLGAGLYWNWAEDAAAIVFVLAILTLLGGMVYYAREVRVALSSVREEAADSRFMDLQDRGEGWERGETPRGM
ncbi:MAG TPA: DUF2721 domain-containing protein [Candidatus Acidoferrales bacterium]|nr:DUF2721 domain-containing protein [Candidatus Acidoferrales bacterium]